MKLPIVLEVQHVIGRLAGTSFRILIAWCTDQDVEPQTGA